jgi:hypothetical protein
MFELVVGGRGEAAGVTVGFGIGLEVAATVGRGAGAVPNSPLCII